MDSVEFPGARPPFDVPGLTVHYHRTHGRAIVRVVPLALQLAKAVREFRPDIVWSPTYRGYGLPIMTICSWSRLPYGLYLHGTEINTEMRSRGRRMAMKSILEGARFLATNSTNTQRLVESSFPGLRTPIVPILPGVNAEPFAAQQVSLDAREIRNDWLRRLADLKNHSPVFLISMCRMSREKGVDMVLRALASLPTDAPPWAYIVAGTGPDLDAFRSLSSALRLDDRVLFLGNVPYGSNYSTLAAADVYIQPSQPVGRYLESFGISFVEAQAAGLACIGSNWGGVPEATIEGETAILLPTGQVEPIADAILELLRSPDRREQMALKGVQNAKRLTWKSHATQLLERLEASLA